MKVYNYSGDYAYQQKKMREEKEALSKKNVEKPQVVEQKTESNVENKVSGRRETNVAQQEETKERPTQNAKVKKGETPKDNQEG